MAVPKEFADYMVTQSHLNQQDQEQRFVSMHEKEILERVKILKNLGHDEDAVKSRLKKYIDSGFEFCDQPAFYKTVDTIVNKVYRKI